MSHNKDYFTYLTIRKDLIEEELSVPVYFLDSKEAGLLEHTDTLNIDCLHSSDWNLKDNGMNTIVSVSDRSKKWKDREAFVYSVDFDWN